MTEIKYMVVATFESCNIKTEGAEFMIGLKTPFYCGNSGKAARLIYNELPNQDKQLIIAKVKLKNINDELFIDGWKTINILK